ncbi:DUF3108 domain-containing protein [Candidatus Colwellia aromaticivorans]|uniref:DUF3108 domain-containing protein n=1 Tax=Candidatus Colwellia aromaticivorans TaxID=2267621 RepID=UPI000DF49202|nr:DUF3108 domain-containing protein [Candidatus Colwellia aromaticivorans]
MKFPLSLLLTILSLTCFSSLAATDKQIENQQVLPEFSAKYTVLHKSDPIGSATRELSYQANGSVNYHYKTHIEWLIFSQTRSETSILTIDNNKVSPQHYIYTREGTGSDKRYEWRYDAAKGKAKDIERKREHQVDFSNNLQDKLSYHLQHRLNLIINAQQTRYIYPVINTSGSIKDYIYQYDGEEELILPYGLIKTIRLKREVKEKDRITFAWFAPELDYLLVKLYQTKAGAEQFEAQLSSLEIEGKIVKK